MQCAPVNRWATTLAGWAAPKIQPKSQIQIRKHFSFSKLFYKLQINLNSNQI
jgi:hypothetical protein